MKKRVFTGAGCAIITPFNIDGSINYNKFEELINMQIAEKTDAIVVMGTTGESATLNNEDHVAAIEFCIKVVDKRVPVIAGCGSNDTAHAIELSKKAEKLGADALLHVTPYYNKTSQKGLIQHFSAIADSVSIPIILYNVPSRTGLKITAETYLELSKKKNIVATKEASGDFSLIAKTAYLCRGNLDIYSGNDDQIVPTLALGGIGVISVASNIIPSTIHEICELYFDGKTSESTELQIKIIDLVDALFCDVNPIPVKEAMNRMGLDSGKVLLPLCETTDANKKIIIQALKRHKLIK